jgi:hypothetical protein
LKNNEPRDQLRKEMAHATANLNSLCYTVFMLKLYKTLIFRIIFIKEIPAAIEILPEISETKRVA